MTSSSSDLFDNQLPDAGTTISAAFTLANGVKMPCLGLGVYQAPSGAETYNSCLNAIKVGYRHIDTAAVYRNEKDVGKAIRECGIPRAELFVTTKMGPKDHGYESCLQAFATSLTTLGLDYVDQYIIHWPAKTGLDVTDSKHAGFRKQSWKAMEEIYASGKAKSIGVSNYTVKHLEEMKSYAHVMPHANQVELHPLLSQPELEQFCRREKIHLVAYSPLARGKLFGNSVLSQLAADKQRTEAQILIRWSLQHGFTAIPKSVKQSRITENQDVWKFKLSPVEMKQLDSLNADQHICWNPYPVL